MFDLFPSYSWLKRLLLLAVSWSLGGCPGSSATNVADIRIDTHRHYQQMTGWEVTARTWEYDKKRDRFDASWEQDSNSIFTQLVDTAGINRIRLALKSGFENPYDYWSDFRSGKIGYKAYKARFYEKINDNQDPNLLNRNGFQFSALDYVVETMLLPLQERLQKRGERLIVNLCYQDFRHSDSTSQLDHAENPEEYAELVVAAFDHLNEKYNIVPDYFEVILEPDNTKSWTGVNIGKGLLAVQQRLSKAGYFPVFIAPGTSRLVLANHYFDEMVAVPGVADILGVFGYHRYASHWLPVWVERYFLQGISKRAQQYGLRSAMLEYLHGDIDDLLDDLTIANVSAWQIWGIASREQNIANQDSVMLLVGQKSGENHAEVKLTGKASLVAPIFRAVREGALRVGALSSNDAVRVVAFDHMRFGFSVHMYIRNPISGTLSLHGLPAGEYRVELIQEGGELRELGSLDVASDQPQRLEFEGSGLLSLVARPGAAVPSNQGGYLE